MKRTTGSFLTVVVGITMVRLALSGEHRLFIRPSMGPWLLLGGLVIIAISTVTLLSPQLVRAQMTGGNPPGPAAHDGDGGGSGGPGPDDDDFHDDRGYDDYGDDESDDESDSDDDDHDHDHDYDLKHAVHDHAGHDHAGHDHAGHDHAGHDHAGHDHAGHDHGRGRLAWLLVVPTALLLLVAPGSLGSFALSRTSSLSSSTAKANWPALAPSDTPVTMATADFVERAFDVGGVSMKDVPVRLTGFVSGTDTDGFNLVRFQIACCAADAVAAQLRVVGPTEGLKTDTWVTVTGVHRSGTNDPAVLDASGVTVIPAPPDPYE